MAIIQDRARRRIENGDEVYIISARSTKEGMIGTANRLGIFRSRVYAEGSNAMKIQRIKMLGIDVHYDNNPDVIKQLPGVGQLV